MMMFIDFDDVIFNTKKFKNDLIDIFLLNGITKKEFERSYYSKDGKSKNDYYDLEKQIDAIMTKKNIDKRKLKKEIRLFMSDLSSYVFDDFYIFTKNFKKKELCLLTYGNEKFQGKKIKGSAIGRYFGTIIITKKNKTKSILYFLKKMKYKNAVLIDDQPKYIDDAKEKSRNLIAFHMRRPEGRYKRLKSKECDYEAKNFFQILKKINKL